MNAEKADRRSISSPKNSARIGSRPVVGNTSMIPPRTEKLPRSSTVSTRSYPAAASSSTTASKPGSAPRSSSTIAGRRSTGAIRSTSASAETATSPPWASASSASARSPTRCAAGSRPLPYAAPREGR